ncbi:hypothetical protein PVAP13_2KG098300 [Panicum virgatum]|uniref:Secreted protein n=1 Tax=Panicum virgatum TaxID=38727 RepID=A0A8T0VZ85_PANVG|nr:hypothetical protein PVAP13_2KG098300 [Panicum virgatum]
MSSIFFHLLNFGVCCRSPVPHACCFCFCLGLGQGFSSPQRTEVKQQHRRWRIRVLVHLGGTLLCPIQAI